MVKDDELEVADHASAASGRCVLGTEDLAAWAPAPKKAWGRQRRGRCSVCGREGIVVYRVVPGVSRELGGWLELPP